MRRRPRCRETEPEDFHAPHDRRGGLHGRDFWPAGNRNVAARGLGDTLDTRDKILLWGSLGLIVGGILLTQVKEEP